MAPEYNTETVSVQTDVGSGDGLASAIFSADSSVAAVATEATADGYECTVYTVADDSSQG